MQVIPLQKIPAQRINIVLDDQPCTISLYWRQRAVYLDLVVSQSPVCIGAICMNRTPIVQSPTELFRGELAFIDLDGDSPPRPEEFYSGVSSPGRWVFLYLSEGENVPPR